MTPLPTIKRSHEPVKESDALAALSHWKAKHTLADLLQCLSDQHRAKLPSELIPLGAYFENNNHTPDFPATVLLGARDGTIHVVRCQAASNAAIWLESLSFAATMPNARYLGQHHTCSVIKGATGLELQAWLLPQLASSLRLLTLPAQHESHVCASVWSRAIARGAALYPPAPYQTLPVPKPSVAWASAHLAHDAQAQTF